MTIPRHHLAKGRQKRRRSHLGLEPKFLVACSHCQRKIVPHRVCPFCGYYKGKEIIAVLARELTKKEKRQKQQK